MCAFTGFEVSLLKGFPFSSLILIEICAGKSEVLSTLASYFLKAHTSSIPLYEWAGRSCFWLFPQASFSVRSNMMTLQSEPDTIYLSPTLYKYLLLTQGHSCAHVAPSMYIRPVLSSHSTHACPHTKYIHRPYQQHLTGLGLVSRRRFGAPPTNSTLNKTKSKTLATVISSTHHQKLPASLKSKRAAGEVLKPVGGF